MKITGTFLDEITHDIPSANWGPEEWARDFDAMKAVGIDTVIMIRAGYKDRVAFDSKVLNEHFAMRPAYEDLVDMFLTEAERCGMDFYFGTYDPGWEYRDSDPDRELRVNLKFTEEVADRYADRKAFRGWYISREICGYDDKSIEVFREMSRHLKGLKDLPILLSPFVRGRKQFDDAITPEQHEEDWRKVFEGISGYVDVVAFQDGQVEFSELSTFMEINARLARENGITSWSNVETFERGMPINFLPIAWPNLRYKMELAEKAQMDKIITFEFSHFLSPNSVYPSAHNLYKRYQQWLGQTGQ